MSAVSLRELGRYLEQKRTVVISRQATTLNSLAMSARAMAQRWDWRNSGGCGKNWKRTGRISPGSFIPNVEPAPTSPRRTRAVVPTAEPVDPPAAPRGDPGARAAADADIWFPVTLRHLR